MGFRKGLFVCGDMEWMVVECNVLYCTVLEQHSDSISYIDVIDRSIDPL